MKVMGGSWQIDSSNTAFRSAFSKTDRKAETTEAKETSLLEAEEDEDLLGSLAMLSEQTSNTSGGGFKMKSSMPDDSVGQLASELARAETRIDVQQVSSKAMRALANLKMASVASEGQDAKKIAQMIRRMEKLIKRVSKKMQHLTKEEQIDNQRKRAEKKQDLQKAQELQDELRSRKNKRKKDERRYAMKEIAEDNKNAAAEMTSSLTSAINPGNSTPDFSSIADIGGFDMSAMGGGIDISV